jgi:hypothetical protein
LKYQPGVPASSEAVLIAGAADRVFLPNIRFDLLRNPDVSAHQA